jgi:hypothetical protein
MAKTWRRLPAKARQQLSDERLIYHFQLQNCSLTVINHTASEDAALGSLIHHLTFISIYMYKAFGLYRPVVLTILLSCGGPFMIALIVI